MIVISLFSLSLNLGLVCHFCCDVRLEGWYVGVTERQPEPRLLARGRQSPHDQHVRQHAEPQVGQRRDGKRRHGDDRQQLPGHNRIRWVRKCRRVT